MTPMTCALCGASFNAVRNTAKFCSSKCRKQSHQSKERKINPVNRTNCPSKRRSENELFELNMRMSETFYGLPPQDRPEYLMSVINMAREGDSKVKAVLTNWKLLRPSFHDSHCHWRGTRQYPTMAQEAHAFAMCHWGAGINLVIDNPELEPPTDGTREQRKKSEVHFMKQIGRCQNKLPEFETKPTMTLKAYVLAVLSAPEPTHQ